MPTAPIGVIGGTFDPIHYGHLRLAEELGEALRAAEVRLIPSGTPPHRGTPQAAAGHRLAMVRLAAAGNPRFTIDDREVGRAGPGYTHDTLAGLRAECGESRPIVLVLGADAFLEFATWHRWHEIFKLAHIAVAHRPGFPVAHWDERMPQPLAREYSARLMQLPLATHLQPAGGVVVVPFTALDISATMIRDRLRAGASVRYLLPDPVIDYIRTHQLYNKEP
ncbi:MAG TPA: nicotinate-nucleotide adenylyltransferase [Burkholderiales bacterium]|nr:nicotinate-nucleotide adenylyltransferase [Burkholderiales bacterium]